MYCLFTYVTRISHCNMPTFEQYEGSGSRSLCLDHISFISGQDLMFLDLLKSPCRAQNAFCARCNMLRTENTPGMADSSYLL